MENDAIKQTEINELFPLLVGEVLRLAFLRTAGGNDTFVRYSAHVDKLEVEFHRGKWAGEVPSISR